MKKRNLNPKYGFTKVPNTYFTNLQPFLKGTELMVFNAIYYSTVGYGKKWAQISYSLFEGVFKIPHTTLQRALTKLIEMGVIKEKKIGLEWKQDAKGQPFRNSKKLYGIDFHAELQDNEYFSRTEKLFLESDLAQIGLTEYSSRTEKLFLESDLTQIGLTEYQIDENSGLIGHFVSPNWATLQDNNWLLKSAMFIEEVKEEGVANIEATPLPSFASLSQETLVPSSLKEEETVNKEEVLPFDVPSERNKDKEVSRKKNVNQEDFDFIDELLFGPKTGTVDNPKKEGGIFTQEKRKDDVYPSFTSKDIVLPDWESDMLFEEEVKAPINFDNDDDILAQFTRGNNLMEVSTPNYGLSHQVLADMGLAV